MSPTISRITNLGPLQDLLLKACPPHRRVAPKKYVPDPDGVKSIKILAFALNMSMWGVQRWIHEGRVPAKRVDKIVEISNGAVTRNDFIPYLF
jgi:hypothetical protein